MATLSHQAAAELTSVFRDRKDELLSNVADFRRACETGALGDHSETGFLATILMTLLEG